MSLCRARTGRKKYIGVFGTRMSGKSLGILHCAADHLWNVKNARILILAKTQGSGISSGIWSEFTEKILPLWFESEGIAPDNEELHMGWAEKGAPKANIAKKMIARTTNRHGGESLVMMDSLDNEDKVEDTFKNRYFTMIIWCEAGEFKSVKTLTTLMLALRGHGHEPDDFILAVDANPPDEGQDHFLFKYFYELRVTSEPSPEEKAIQECLHVTEWSMDDNPFLSENDKNAVKGIYLNDPDLYDRYVRGMWKRAIRDSLFSDVFKRGIHVLESDDKSVLWLPSENCVEMVTGTDPGGVNPFWYALEQLVFTKEIKTQDGMQLREISCFQYLDELGFIGQEISVAEFTGLALERMESWEHQLGHQVTWWHYADSSALNFKESIAQRTVSDEMFAESNGRIKLIGVEKGKGSVGLRIRMWRRLLMEQRILIAGNKCPKLIEMCQCIRRGKAEGTIAKHDRFKHPFDAATYPLVRLMWRELQTMVRSVRQPQSQNDDTVFHMAL